MTGNPTESGTLSPRRVIFRPTGCASLVAMDGTDSAHWKKLPSDAEFLDISDYARPMALRVVAFLQHRPISVLTVTSSFLVVGLVAAVFIAEGSYPSLLAAIALIQIKNLLDAVDGSLARARKTPSRIGRFYDSFCDFIVGAAIFLALGYLLSHEIGLVAAPIALAAFLSVLLQNSLYCYHTVAHRLAAGGDTTSQLDERQSDDGDGDWRLRYLSRAYVYIYSWQDDLAARSDRGAPLAKRPTAFLTALSLCGLGTQLLGLCVFLAADQPVLFLWFVLGPMNLLTIGLVLWRRHSIRQT